MKIEIVRVREIEDRIEKTRSLVCYAKFTKDSQTRKVIIGGLDPDKIKSKQDLIEELKKRKEEIIEHAKGWGEPKERDDLLFTEDI